ncbi:MAG: M28 family peptidase [Rubrivivax sp.]|nr:M28 family peptidase [Rubrivivax sp.]
MPPTYADADLAHARALRERGLADPAALRLLRELCTGIGARPAGSPADAQAQAWARAALGQLGLEGVRAEEFALRVWQRGPAAARLLAQDMSRPLTIAALGNSVATAAGGIDAEVAWYPDLAALRADTTEPGRSRAHGRIVFIDQRTERTRDGRGYGAAVGARINGPVEAARRGALALAIRSIGTSGTSGIDGIGGSGATASATTGAAAAAPVAHTGATRYDLSVPRIPAFAVSVRDAELIAAQQAAGRPLRLQFTLEARSGVDARSANVIAEWRGTDLAHEVVLIGAHLDSWDVGQGAQDNGAGVAIVSAAAGVIAAAGRRARRTIRVVLFGNEENGFDGALDYGNRHKDEPHQLVAESDFGAGRLYAFTSRVASAALPLAAQVAQVLAPLGLAHPEGGRNAGSPGPDAALLMRRHRWPALALAQDGSRYFDVHHTADDTLERLDAGALPQNVAAWAAMAWLAAQAPVSFGPPAL